jgi:hypothetical protein
MLRLVVLPKERRSDGHGVVQGFHAADRSDLPVMGTLSHVR